MAGRVGLRSRFTASVTVALAALVLASCTLSGGSTQVVVATWGGDYESLQKKHVEPAFESDSSASVVFDAGDASTRMAKLRTERDGPGSFDVVGLDHLEMQEMVDAGLLQKLDRSKLDNADAIKQSLRSDYWIPHIYSAQVLLYNAEKVSPRPTSWQALWDPRYEGKIGVEDTTGNNWLFAAAAAEKGGDPGSDWDAGWQRLLELAGSVKVYGSSEQLGQALVSGEVWMTIDYKARAYQWAQDSDTPLKSVVPREGTVPQTFAAGIPKNAPNPEEAYAYLDAMLAKSAQRAFAENMGYLPVVQGVSLPAKLEAGIGFTAEEQRRIHDLDESYVVKRSAEWRQRWQQQFLNQ